MANNTLDPVTERKLAQLARRRRRLLIARGAFAAVLTLLVAMALVALADRLVVLSMPVRITLSLLAYLSVALMAYRVSVRYLLSFPSRAELARLIETAEPSLREDLVSAVELSKDDASLYDSPAFRAVLQRNVARKVSNLDTDRVLPWRLVAWWAAVSTGATVVTIALILVPGLRYGDLLARAMMPAADLDRVSDVRITLISPALDANGRVPMNDDLPIEVAVTGGAFDDVILDFEQQSGDHGKLTMWRGEQPQRFSVSLPVGDTPLRFRVRAGDGQTRYYQLNPIARPAITTFSQVVHAPEYTGWEPRRVRSADGAIDALTGSVVDLTLTASQPIKQGRMVIELPEGEKLVPLYIDPADATTLTTSLPVEVSTPYRVELIARETGFDNPQAPRYEINARPDQLPVVQLTRPEGSSGQPADALVRMIGRAGDDVGLREVSREVRINGGAWGPALVAVGDGGRISEPLDLLPLALRVGDAVELRLVATDLAGNTGYSAAARMVVTPDGLEQIDEQAVRDQRGLLNALVRLKTTLPEARQRYESARSQAGDGTITARQTATQALIAEQALMDELLRTAHAVDRAIVTAQPGMEAGLIVEIGGAVAEAELQTSVAPVVSGDGEAIGRAMDGVVLAERAVEDAYQNLWPHVEAREAALIIQRLNVLAADLGQMSSQAGADVQVDADLAQARLERRLSLAQDQALEVVSIMNHLAQRPEAQRQRDRLREAATHLTGLLNEQANAMRGEKTTEMMRQLAGALSGRLSEIEQRVWPAWVELADQSQAEHRRQPRPIPLDADALASLPDAVRAGNAEQVFDPTVQRLRRRVVLEEDRPAADHAFVALSNRAVIALELIGVDLFAGEEPGLIAERIGEVRAAYQTIERVQALAELRGMVARLAAQERDDVLSTRSPMTHRLVWSAIEPRFDVVAVTLAQEPLLTPAVERVQRAMHSDEARRVTDAMNQRRQIGQRPNPVPDELDAIVRMLDEALTAARPVVDAARDKLSKQTPSLAQRMRELADRADAMAGESRQAAEDVNQNDSAQAIERAQQLGERQERFAGALDRLSNDLRREANQQDLLTEPGRDVARDIDDTIAMLKPDAEEARQQLDLAARQTTRAHERPDAIQQAAEAQARSADTLRQLAEHFDNLGGIDPAAAEQSRQALRDAEQELGIKDELDAQYERMQRLAELAQTDDAQRLADLEQQLAQDEGMQRELDRIAQELADRAQQRLEDAARAESGLAEQLGNVQRQQDRTQSPFESRIDELADQARRLERDRVAPLGQLAERGAPEARPELRQAGESLKEASAQAQQDEQRAVTEGAAQEQRERSQTLADATREAADQMRQAAQDARDSAEQARQQQEQARRAADRANREGVAAPEAAQQVIESDRQRERAERVQSDAEDVARRTEELAQQAEQLNNAVQQQGRQGDQTRQAGAQQQQDLAEQAGQAADELARAARHEQRLGDEAQAAQLEQSARGAEQLAEQALPEAGERIGEPGPMQQAEQAARQAEQALREQAAQVDGSSRPQQGQPPAQLQQQQQPGSPEGRQAEQSQGQNPSQQPGQQPQQQQPGQQQSGPQQAANPQPGQPSGQQPGQPPQQGQQAQAPRGDGDGQPLGPLPPEVAEQLARELDRLDRQLNNGQTPMPSDGDAQAQSPNGQPQQGQSQQGQSQQAQGEGPPQPGEGEGQPHQAQGPKPGGRPIDAAAQAQQQAMRDARRDAMPGQSGAQPGTAMADAQKPGQPGQNPATGLNGSPVVNQSTFDPSRLAERAGDDQRDWGDLPPRMAEDLSRGERDRAPAEYIDQVDAYFRAIARRAREQRDDQ